MLSTSERVEPASTCVVLSTSKAPQVKAIHDSVVAEQWIRADQNTCEWKDCEELGSLKSGIDIRGDEGSSEERWIWFGAGM